MSLLSVRDLSLSASESSLVGPISFELEAGENSGSSANPALVNH